MKSIKGFTLIEIIVYTAIIAIIFILVVNSLTAVIKAFNQGRVAIKMNNSTETAMERITREIRFAFDIDSSSSLGFSPGRLVLNTYDTDSPGTPTTIEFYLDSGKLMIKEGVLVADQLTSSDLTVINLVFHQIITPSISKAVKIEMTIQGSSGNYQKTEDFYNTVILRGSY